MIDPSPSANPGQVVSETPGSYCSPLTAIDPRAPQTDAVAVESPESSPSRSPHEVQETNHFTAGDLHTLRSDPHAYVPPPVGSEASSSPDLRSSPQVYPENVDAYHQDGVSYQTEPSYVGMPYTYPQPHPQSYPQPYVQPYYFQPAVPQSQLHETPHLPLDYISLPTTAALTQQASTPHHSSTHNNVSQVTPQPSHPYPTPTPTTPAPVRHGSVDAGPPPTPIKQSPRQSRRKRWMFLFLLVLVAIGVGVGVVLSTKNDKKVKGNENGGDQPDAGKGGSPGGNGSQGPSSNATTVVKTTSSTTVTATATATATGTAAVPSPSDVVQPTAPPEPPSPTKPVDPPQKPPTKPTSPPTKPPPSGDFWTCFDDCFKVRAACDERCKNEESYKSCVNGCSDTHCRLACENQNPCLNGCFHENNRCTDACGSPP